VRETIAMFGPTRAMFASNFPVDSLCGSFDTILGGFKTIAARWSRSDQRRLFYENARAVYRTGESEQLLRFAATSEVSPMGGVSQDDR
jgi:predicted TIM-barrel fold metal-dependent hydrolase